LFVVKEILSYLKRSFNALNDASMPARKKAILNIYEKLAESKFAISGSNIFNIKEGFFILEE